MKKLDCEVISRMKKIINNLFSLALTASLLVSVLPCQVRAEEANLLDDKGQLVISNQAELMNKIKEAEASGVKVTTQDQTNKNLYDTETDKLEKAKKEIEESYTNSINSLKTAIEKQKENNKAYYNKLKASFEPFLKYNDKDVWTFEQFKKFLLTPDEQKLSEELQVKKMMDRMSGLSIVTPTNETQLIAKNIGGNTDINEKSEDNFSVNDWLRYGKVFKSANGEWVDLKITLTAVEPMQGQADQDTKKVNFVSDKYRLNEPFFFYGNKHLTLKVDFLKHNTDETDTKTETPISILPLIVFTDIDGKQAVEIKEGDFNAPLAGSKVEVEGGKCTSVDDQDNTQGSNKNFWALYSGQNSMTSFTYKFYQGNPSDVYQGLGGKDVVYTAPTDKLEKVDCVVTIIKQPVEKKPEPEKPVEPEKPNDEIPYVPSDPTEPVVTEVVEPKVGKVAKTGELANMASGFGLVMLVAFAALTVNKRKK